MSTRTPFRVGFSLMLLAALAAGCKTPQAQQIETAGLRIDVLSAKAKRGRLEVAVRIWNDHDETLAFSNNEVRLILGDRQIAAQPGARRQDKPSVRPRLNGEFRWVFEVASDLQRGDELPIEIRNMSLDELPVLDTAMFTVRL